MADSRGQSNVTVGSSDSDSTWQKDVVTDSAYKRVYDIVCIGFGCKSISLAIALDETCHDASVLFLEGQPQSAYVPFNRLPGSFMQLSFLNDLVTLENPRSKFSFINYLHSTDQLIQFTNLGCIQPLREHFALYLDWCVDQLDDKVQYASEATAVRPVRIHGGLVDAWSVEYNNVETGKVETIITKQVVCAEEPRISVPIELSNPDVSSSVLHASDCLGLLSALSQDLANQHQLIVIGNGQEAAEIVESVCSMRGSHQVTWLQTPLKDGAGDTDPTLDHRLYERQYSQRVCEQDPQRWTLRVHSDVVLRTAYREANGKVHLSYTASDTNSREAEILCDFVIAATGYERPDYKQLLKPVQDLLHEDRFTVNRRGGVDFKTEAVEQDCGIWLLGSDKVGDQSFAQMAATSRYLVDSLMRKLGEPYDGRPRIQSRL